MRHLVILISVCLAMLLCGSCNSDNAPAGAPALQPVAADPAVPADLQARLVAELERVLAQRGITLDDQGRPVGKSLSAAPKLNYLDIPKVDQPNGDAILAWTHYQVGDYDHNGEVNIADLTPIGLHNLKDTSSPDWGTAAWRADGDGNGEVNIADVTPIGLNFGALVAGYKVEARSAAGWQEYGFIDFDQGFEANGITFNYTAHGGSVEAEYRVTPAGQRRDFAWSTYRLPGGQPAQFIQALSAAVVDGRPMITFAWSDGGFAEHAGFAIAGTARPASELDWHMESDLLLDIGHNYPPSMCALGGLPSLAYAKFQPATLDFGIYFSRRDSNSAAPALWDEHAVATGLPNATRVALVPREGRPAILYDNGGIRILQAAVQTPTTSAEWIWGSANPNYSDVRGLVGVSSGPYLFSCGYIVSPDYYLIFNRSNTPAASSPADFTEYILSPAQESYLPSLRLIGGIPCIAYTDQAALDLKFLQASSRTDSSAASWFLHTIAASAGNDEHWQPTMALCDGRPAVAAGYTTIDLHWAGGQFPDNTDDWSGQRVVNNASGIAHTLVVTDGLPIIIYTADFAGQNILHVALANEQ